MRICYIAVAKSIHTQRWARYFANKGHEVHLISLGRVESDHIENVKLHLLKKIGFSPRVTLPLNVVLILFQIKRLIHRISPDILHAHYITSHGMAGALSGFHPFVVSAWGSDVLVEPKKSKIYKWQAKYALKAADLIHCDAEHIKKPLMELGAEPQKINLIYFGVDTQKFRPKEKEISIEKELNLCGSPIVISLRSLKPLYDVSSLITSIPMVLKKVPQAKFVIAGKGSQEEELKKLAESLGVSNSVRFVGEISNEALPRYLTSSDVYVSTSLSDAGLSSCTAEAMACRLPVIITDFGDNRKWVEDGINGFIVPLKDPKTLAEKIIYLLKNEEVRLKFGRINRKIIEERNNYYKEMEKMENIYRELVERYK